MVSDRDIIDEINSTMVMVIDFDRVNQLTDNGKLYKEPASPISTEMDTIPQPGYKVSRNTITRMLKMFENEVMGKYITNIPERSKEAYAKTYFIVKTLKANGILINDRQRKIDNILDE
jgi:hypothetical protein